MIFRLTKTAQTQLNNPVPETADAENRYCEWFVNIFRNNRKKYFLITNAYSFLSVIIPAKGITSVTAFYDAAITELKNYCDYKAIPDFFSTYIAPYTKEPKTSATNNRSVLSVMNQIKLYTEDVALETAALSIFMTSLENILRSHWKKNSVRFILLTRLSFLKE